MKKLFTLTLFVLGLSSLSPFAQASLFDTFFISGKSIIKHQHNDKAAVATPAPTQNKSKTQATLA